MSDDDREARLLKRLLLTFKGEATERIGALAQGLTRIETSGAAPDAGFLESMFRDAHSLKAAARSVAQKEIELLCQSLESVFAAMKRGSCAPSPTLVAAMVAARDAMEDCLACLEQPSAQVQARAAAAVRALDTALDGNDKAASAAAVSAPAPPPERNARQAPVPPDPAAPEPTRAEGPATPSVETVRLSVQRLEELLRDSEEMLPEKLVARQTATRLQETILGFADWHREWAKARHLLGRAAMQGSAAAGLRDFLDWNERHLAQLEAHLTTIAKSADAGAHRLGLKTDRLLREVRDVLTLPCSSLLEPFPRTIRGLARDQQKEVDTIVEGSELAIDRRILQELREPLLHLVRNALDHGIERPAERVAAGKPARATIAIRVANKDGDKVEFVVSDDGAGISSSKLALSATKLGVLSPEQAAAIEEAQLLELIFESGVSTSTMITDMSGRGLGLAIVRERVERLGGRLSVETEPGKGTCFRLLLPLSLATYHGISVRIGEQLLVLPTLAVAQVVGARRSAVATLEGRPMLEVGGLPVPLVKLHEVLELPPPGAASERLEAVIVGPAGRQIAFEVDSVLGDQEILLKPLGKCLVRVRNVLGGTILGTGEIAPILNVSDLMKSALRLKHSAAPESRSQERLEEASYVLVVEDSITARGLLRGILEAAGYRVKTAVDGMDAWATLNLEPFDLVVSDVDMPRMNGFELTTRIRAHGRLSELPVILVTALASPEDRERGAEAGANAYILKGGFEQGALLEAVRRLI